MGGAAAAATGALLGGCTQPGTGKPNILWIIAEDFSPHLGCYGTKEVHTPNIDRLASEGVRFNRAFTTAPVCSASRSGIVVGMYQTSVGGHNHRSHRDDDYHLPAGVRPFTHYFREGGYHTSNVKTAAPGVRGTGKTDFNFNVTNVFDGDDWNQRKEGQPFYAQINLSETHRAFYRFPDRPVDPAAVELPPYYPDHPAMREDWAVYLDSAQHLDVKVGKILQRLKDEGLEENTIVFFFGDHGQPMPRGKQFLYDDGIRIPLMVRIPARFRPEGFTPGTVRQDMVSAIDITATSLKLAGIDPPAHMQGQMMLGPDAGKRQYIFSARDRCDETVDRIRSVRTERFKYIKNFYPERAYTQPNVYKDTSYPPLQLMRQLQEEGRLSGVPALFMAARRPAEELYDLQADPHEVKNLASEPEHQKTLEELRGALNRWIKETNDHGETPENPLPDEYKYRVQVDGWCSRGRCIMSKANSLLRMQCGGKGNDLRRAYVTEPGDLTLKLRVRSADTKLNAFTWGTIAEMNQKSAKSNRVNLDFAANGQWQELTVPFKVAGSFLSVLEFDIAEGDGLIEFDWFRLYRGTKLLRGWEFS